MRALRVPAGKCMVYRYRIAVCACLCEMTDGPTVYCLKDEL